MLRDLFYLTLFYIVQFMSVFITCSNVNNGCCGKCISYIMGDSLAENVEENKYKRFDSHSYKAANMFATICVYRYKA
jgi:hypothetical protein